MKLQATQRNVVFKKIDMKASGPLYQPHMTDIYEAISVGPNVKDIAIGDKCILSVQRPQRIGIEPYSYYCEAETTVIVVLKTVETTAKEDE
jgi:hypothetical protein